MSWRRALVACALAVGVAHCLWFSGFTVDDGAISFSYARNLAQGHGLVLFAGGERVEGYTNFLWVVLLALGMRLGGDPFFLSHLYGALLCGGAVLATAALCARLRGRPSPLDGAAALLTALLPPVAYWAMSGLEGGLYTALVAACAFTLLREEDEPARFPWSALCAAGCALTRPDGLSVLLVACLYRLWRGKRRLAWLALALVPVALHFTWRYAYYAWPWPNTFYAKVTEPFRLRELVEFRGAGWSYVLGLVERYRLWALAVPAAAALWPKPGFPRRAFVVALLGVLVFFPIYSRGDWMSEGRFLVAALPLLCALAVVGPEVALGGRRVALLPVAIAALIVVPIALTHSRERRGHYPVPAARVAERGRHYRALADRYQVEHPSALDGDLGGTSYYAGMPIVDLGMLADVTLARYRHDPSVEREYVHGERRPTFMRLSGFWLDDGLQSYEEFVDHQLPSGMADITIDRRAFLASRVDPRTPLVAGDDGVDLLGVRVGARDVDAWLRVTRDRPPRAPALRTAQGASIALADVLFPSSRWRHGDLVRVRVPRPPGALTACAGASCVPLAEGDNGARPADPARPTPAFVARALAHDELAIALAAMERLGQPTTEIARRLYARAGRAQHEGDTGRAFRDYGLALRADPSLSFARKGLEALRLAPRPQYHPRDDARVEEALRDFTVAPDAERLGLVAVLAHAAGRPEAAADAYLATRLAPGDGGARLALAECLADDGYAEEARPLFPIDATDPVEHARVDALAELLGLPTSAPGAARDLGGGLELGAAEVTPTPSGRVRLALALRGRGAPSLEVGGRGGSFDRTPASWGGGGFVEERVLSLPPGESHVRVGSADLGVSLDAFTQDFEDGALDGWTGDGDAFGSVTRWRPALRDRGFEGHFYVSSYARGDGATGTLRSPPLREGVDQVCFAVGGGLSGVGVRIEPGDAPPASGRNDWLMREACLPATAGARIVVFDEGKGSWQHVAVDDFACFSRGRPVTCAGGVRLTGGRDTDPTSR